MVNLKIAKNTGTNELDTNLQKIHKTSFKYNKLYTNKLKLQQVLH